MLGICESTVKRWVRHGLIARHAYSGQAYLYEPPGPNLPPKAMQSMGPTCRPGGRNPPGQNQDARFQRKEVQYEVR